MEARLKMVGWRVVEARLKTVGRRGFGSSFAKVGAALAQLDGTARLKRAGAALAQLDGTARLKPLHEN